MPVNTMGLHARQDVEPSTAEVFVGGSGTLPGPQQATTDTGTPSTTSGTRTPDLYTTSSTTYNEPITTGVDATNATGSPTSSATPYRQPGWPDPSNPGWDGLVPLDIYLVTAHEYGAVATTDADSSWYITRTGEQAISTTGPPMAWPEVSITSALEAEERKTKMIAGAVGGALSAVILILIGGFVYYRRTKRAKTTAQTEKGNFHNLRDSYYDSETQVDFVGDDPFADSCRAQTPSIIHKALEMSEHQDRMRGSQASQSIIASTDAPSEYSSRFSTTTHSTQSSSHHNPVSSWRRNVQPTVPASLAESQSTSTRVALGRSDSQSTASSSARTITQENASFISGTSSPEPRVSGLERWRNRIEVASVSSEPVSLGDTSSSSAHSATPPVGTARNPFRDSNRLEPHRP